MEPASFKEEMRLLTGRSVTKLTPEEDAAIDDFLADALKNDKQLIDYSQFNELLLIVNKDRVTEFFFQFFFGKTCTIKDIDEGKDIHEGVEKFQKIAMLCFGNFIYAYRTLSKIQTHDELERHLGDYCRDASALCSKFKNRGDKILDIKAIPKDRTPLLGYISSGAIREERRIAEELSHKLLPESETWEDLLYALEAMREKVKDQEKEVAVVDRSFRLIEQFRKNFPVGATPADLQLSLEQDKPKIDARYQTLLDTEGVGNKNTDTYLTWDHMDIYFATSMRKRWEYEDLFRFVTDLMNQPIDKLPKKLENLQGELQGKTLRDLKVRHFDPTQSFDMNRINKGLIESLMLKRAACTVYSVQDTDTLGKDSELAATLAQGKPVIAYAPTINIEEETDRLFRERPADLKFRLQFVLFADERDFKPEDTGLLLSFLPRLEEFEKQMLWKSITDEEAKERFQQEHREELTKFCEVIARSEARIYDNRAKTLLKVHPLAIQVNLESGVANGVLVVRDIPTCADLLLRTLTGTMEFEIGYNPETECWELKETLTKSIYRVVTNDPKLTNCFWNFYPQRTQDRRRREQ